MAVDDSKYIYIRYFVLAVVFLAAAAGMPLPLQAASPADSLAISPVSPTVPRTYDELLGAPLPADLGLPRNVVSSVEYDAESGCYVLRTRVGDKDIATPFILTSSQYARWRERNERRQRFRMLDGGPGVDNDSVRRRERRQFDLLDMNFDLGPLDRIFGPGGVRLTTTGSVQITTAVKSTKTDNPALSLNSRRKTFFDFDQKIQATVAASVGDRMKFNLNYNTDATFDFDSKNLKLQYEGTEDDIVRNIEAGNVSMTTGSSLIRGSTALFGIKSTLQFGRLTATALVSQQNSETRSINTRGGVQTTAFSLNADEYDANRHYFLAQYFRDHYDEFASRLPYVGGGINITRIEVWITNKGNNYSQSRNLTAFMDLAETTRLASDHWTVSPSATVPSNTANNLLQTIKNDYPTARFISSVSQALAPLGVFGIQGGTDYEKVESARLLSESEYTLNPTLGYISLKSQLAADEVLAVAFEYTCQGQVYQVGEFSADISDTSQSLYVKMLKSTTQNPRLPMWRLMMKNVYSLGAYQVQPDNFKLQVKYLSDTTGIEIPYLPVAGLSSTPLLQLMGLDRLDSNREGNPDGFFDFIEGYTVQTSTGKVIFPVAEPFGSNLVERIGSQEAAAPFVYQELYDSTLVVARQFADKNKFVITGEYRASGGAQIRLDAMNVPRGSVVVTAGGVTLTENTDYTVDYALGIVTITNQSIIDSGQDVSVTLENQSLFSTQRKTLLGLDMTYRFSKDFYLGATLMHYSEKALTEKVNIGNETVSNTIYGLNFGYATELPWVNTLLNKVPTIDATAPSRISLQGELARLQPAAQKSGSDKGSSFIDDFESSQTGIDLRSPYSWFLASTPYDNGPDPLFPEAALSDNPEYGKNRALLNWYYIDRMFTQRNSSLCPGYLRADFKQQSNPYVREVTSREIFPDRQLTYGESSTIQTLNLSFYPEERGPYNVDAERIDDQGRLLQPEKRWGGIMRRLDNTNFEQSNIEYVQFWLMNPFLDPENPNTEGGDLYFNFGEISEDILKDGLKSYENGIPADGDDRFMRTTSWGRVSDQNSLTYAFDNNTTARRRQDVGLDGLPNDDEFEFPTYAGYVEQLRGRLSPEARERMEADRFSPLNDPAGDNYHFYRGRDYDEQRLGILERYKRYNGVDGNSLSPEEADDPLYQSSRNMPDVEDINQDNTLNEYERYFQYRVSIRPQDLRVGTNYITDKQTSLVSLRDGTDAEVEWYQFKIPLADFERVVGSISDLSTVRFVRMFMTGFRRPTHLRFATLELVRGEWRTYDYNLNSRGDMPASGQLDVSVVNIEENSGRTPVNYVLPPGVSRLSDPAQQQIVQLNEQSMSLRVTDLAAGDARGVYRNTMQDLRNYRRLQMWVHAEQMIDDPTALRNGELSLFVRLGTDIRNNFYEYEIPLRLTPQGHYADTRADREKVWPEQNRLDIALQTFVDVKKLRNRAKTVGEPGVGYATLYSVHDPECEANTVSVLGNPSLSDVRVMMIGVRNTSPAVKDGTVWVNELKVTDFNSEGGWAAKGVANLMLSDIATIDVGGQLETAGFGAVDQGLNSRRMDDFRQFNFAVQTDVGKIVPSKLALRAPVYYSVVKENTTPKYNPLDRDVLLKDALDDASSRHERDSIKAYAVERATVRSFSVSGLNFGVRSKNPMPWDPANFTLNFSFNRQSKADPTTEYENTDDYRGSLQYSYAPRIKPLKPFARMVGRRKSMKFLSDWEFNWLPSQISFLTTMSRYYHEEQTRSEIDAGVRLPVQVGKNFLWDRQLNLAWSPLRSLSLTFSSNTSARIDEPIGAVNRRLFPDRYKEWKDTVMQSILHLGTPWAYNQTFTGAYRAPFNQIPAIDFLTGQLTYNATYRWNRGATVDGVTMGNKIANQGSWTAEGRLAFDKLYNKIPYLKRVSQRFSVSAQRPGRGGRRTLDRPKRFERNYPLSADTSTIVTHNLRTKKVKLTALDLDTRRPVRLQTRVIDDNSIEILTRDDRTIQVRVVELRKERDGWLDELAQYAARLMMSPRSAAVRWRSSRSLSLPLFIPDVGNVFGQSRSFGPMSPGLDFAFGFTDDSYVEKALSRGWLMTDDGQVSPAVFSRTSEVNLELTLEPVNGLKIQLIGNRTDNRTSSIQFMYAGMPVTYAGSYTKTHCAIATSLRSSKASDGYASKAFTDMIEAIPVVASRLEQAYARHDYPSSGFMHGSALAGMPYNPANGGVSQTSSDVLVPAFIAAYTGRDPGRENLDPFPSLASVMPNWRVTYDGLVKLPKMSDLFKAFTLTHAYQCTYSVGSYSSYLNWVSVEGERLGFTLDELSGNPVPSSPFNISSVAITERFAPLIGVAVTLKNDLTFNAEWRNQRTLTLNTSAGQVVEATSSGLTAGVGYKITNFNTVLKIRGSQQGISNDLTVNADFSLQTNQALIRRIETAYTQATSGTRTLGVNLTANYVLSRRMTLGMFFEHHVNTPIVSSNAYPVTDSAFGLSFNLNLSR
ncbi:cell surface protein SprA [Paramuribaculum intestinale]|nr:cell surface protein SprA [Paramuribaculum intestinale]